MNLDPTRSSDCDEQRFELFNSDAQDNYNIYEMSATKFQLSINFPGMLLSNVYVKFSISYSYVCVFLLQLC